MNSSLYGNRKYVVSSIALALGRDPTFVRDRLGAPSCTRGPLLIIIIGTR